MSEDMTGTTECLRCGSLLPSEDEGICPTCGTEFGRATMAMPALKKPIMAAGAPMAPAPGPAPSPIEAALGPDAPPAFPAPPPVVIHPTAGGTRSSGGGLIVVLVIIIGLIVAVIAVILALLFVSGDATPPEGPSFQPPVEAPAPPAEN